MSRIDNQTLLDIEINTFGDWLFILQHIQKKSNSPTVTAKPIVLATSKPLPLHNKMAHAQFRKFKVDWDVYKQLTLLPPTQIASSLCNECEDSVENAIVNTIQNFFMLAEVDILTTLEKIVTHQVNLAVHCMHFSSLIQNGQESIQDFVVDLLSI